MKKLDRATLPAILLLLLSFYPATLFATIRYVTTTGAGSKDGSSWANASDDLQAMINASSAGDKIYVAAGTYKPTHLAYDLNTISVNNRHCAFVLKPDVKIYGGFDPDNGYTEESNRKLPGTNNGSVLSGNLGNVGSVSDNAYHVVIAVGNTADNWDNTLLDGFTIQEGHASSTSNEMTVNGHVVSSSMGGGIYVYRTYDIQFKNCWIRGNRAGRGGGLFNNEAGATCYNCIFSGNYTTKDISGGHGGGLYSTGGHMKLYNCTIACNRASGGSGGAMNAAGPVTMVSCIINGNTAGNGPNGIRITSGGSNFSATSCLIGDGGDYVPSPDNSVISSNALFVAPNLTTNTPMPNTGGDYRLQKGSPCINTGSPSYPFTDTDIQGINRIKSSQIDMGAYEYFPADFNVTVVSQSNTSCHNNGDGSVTIEASGGNPPYTYYWYPTGFTSQTVTQFHAGAYTCTVTDADGQTSEIDVTISSPPILIANIINAKNASKYGGSNGSATVQVSGGGAPYTYAWSPGGGTDATATGLSAGKYTCTITDNYGCSISKSVTITQPDKLQLYLDIIPPCYGETNGSASVSYSGGTMPVTFTWSPAVGTYGYAENLPPGDYTVTGVDAGGDSVTLEFTIEELPPILNKERLYVNSNAAASGDGASWAEAFKTLQEALDLASNECADTKEIWVAAGVYKPTAMPLSGRSNRDKSFILPSGVKIYGGFAGTESTLEERDLSNPANKSILSGDFNDDDVVTGSSDALSITGNEENARRVVYSVENNADTRLDGFTIQGANAVGSIYMIIRDHVVSHSNGGGMYLQNSKISVVNCVFTQNTADQGGGLCIGPGSFDPVVANCLFLKNMAITNGSALINFQRSSVVNCTFYGNRGTGSNTYAVHCKTGTFSLRNSIVYGNNGGFSNGTGTVHINNCLIQGLTSTANGNIHGDTDPLFTDPANGDFTLQSTSPLIGKGNNAYISIASDIAGNPRVHDDIVDIGAFEYTPPSTLPATLTHFTGILQNGMAQLRWNTGIEDHFAYFEIQKAVVDANGDEHYQPVGRLDAKGNNSHYIFNTPQPELIALYRLRMVDIDQHDAFSKIVVLRGKGNNSIMLYPNPAKDHINISVAKAGIISIYDAAGKHVKTQTLRAGNNRVDLSALKAGVYFGSIDGERIQFVKE